MRHAIFLAIARDAKIEIGISQFGCAADRAFVKRFGFAARVIFKTFPAAGDFVTMPRSINKFGSEENQVIGKRRDQSRSIRIWISKKSQEQERPGNPSEPLDSDRQNEKDVNDFLRIKVGEGQEQRHQQHRVRKIAAEEKRGRGGANHPNQNVKRETKRSPGAVETFTDPPKKPEREQNPQRALTLRNENVSDQPPDFTVTNANGIKREHGSEAGQQPGQAEDEGGEPDKNARQSRDSEKTEAALKSVQQTHRCGK